MNEHAKPGRRPVHRGDEVYFDHPSGPLSGKVLAHGQHGCTVECGGKRHQVKWDKLLGHKKRASVAYQVLDHGEDGMVVKDASGRRRFIGIEPGQAPERILIKQGKA